MKINDIYMDWGRGRLIVSLDEAYTGDIDIPVTILGVVSEKVIYNFKNAMLKQSKDPFFSPMKEKVQDHNAMIG